MRAKNKVTIPSELRQKISPLLLTFAVDERRVMSILYTAFAAWMLYGPITVHPDHNGFLYLVAPWIIPSIVAILCTWFPFRPYRGVFYAKNMRDVDRSDPVIMRLVDLYKSAEATRHLWHETLKLSATLFAILGTSAFLLRHSLNWTLPSSRNNFLSTQVQGPGHWFLIGLIGCFICSYISLSTDYIGWGITTWAKRETAHHVVKF